MEVRPLIVSNKKLTLHKSIHSADFRDKSVLSLDPFNYVDLWLKREKMDDAVHFWRQSKDFYQASKGLPMESAPLLLYYCYMNAAKALLSAKNISFNSYHGVMSNKMSGTNAKKVLSNEGIKIKNNGIVPSLSGYFNETETRRIHSLLDVLYNLAVVHRTFTLTYNKAEKFIPVKSLEFR